MSCICGYENCFYSSEKSGKGFDINKRLVYSMRSCGQGFGGMERFAVCMNMPKPMNKNNYNKLAISIKEACKVVAEETMSDAASELRAKQTQLSNKVVNEKISCDGSWQRRGFSSLNGFVAAISMDNGKVLDAEPMSRYCRSCYMHEKTKHLDMAG